MNTRLPSGDYGINDFDGYEFDYGELRHRRSRQNRNGLHRMHFDGFLDGFTPERIIDVFGVAVLAIVVIASMICWNTIMDALFFHIMYPFVVYATRILAFVAIIAIIFGFIRRRLFWF